MAVTVPKVRFWISDRSPEDNPLTGDLEFTDEEIYLGMEHAAREYNSIPPVSWRVDPRHLPDDTNMFFEATAEALYKTVLHRLQRNQFTYQAGNVQVDDVGQKIKGLKELIAMVGTWRQTAQSIKLKNDTAGYFVSF